VAGRQGQARGKSLGRPSLGQHPTPTHHACHVAGGHLTDTPVESVYSSVVSLRSVRMVIFLAGLGGQSAWCADVGNAYLESETQEKVHIIGGPEFEELHGH